MTRRWQGVVHHGPRHIVGGALQGVAWLADGGRGRVEIQGRRREIDLGRFALFNCAAAGEGRRARAVKLALKKEGQTDAGAQGFGLGPPRSGRP